jgi:hypothetical protein
VIRREFAVGYRPAHVSRLLKALRHSLQKPQRRANQSDEEAMEHWKEKRWPQLINGALKEARTIVLADQSGFYLLPMVVRTYASVGRTLVLKENLTRDDLLGDERHNPRREALHDRLGSAPSRERMRYVL